MRNDIFEGYKKIYYTKHYFFIFYPFPHLVRSSKGNTMHNHLFIQINECIFHKKVLLLSSLNAQTDHDCHLKNHVIKTADFKLYIAA